jgi:hypothetical protein
MFRTSMRPSSGVQHDAEIQHDIFSIDHLLGLLLNTLYRSFHRSSFSATDRVPTQWIKIRWNFGLVIGYNSHHWRSIAHRYKWDICKAFYTCVSNMTLWWVWLFLCQYLSVCPASVFLRHLWMPCHWGQFTFVLFSSLPSLLPVWCLCKCIR